MNGECLRYPRVSTKCKHLLPIAPIVATGRAKIGPMCRLEASERVFFFAEMVADGSLSFLAVFFDPDSWHEIDTLEDLHNAELFFNPDGSEQAAAV